MSMGLRVRLSAMMFLQYFVWGIWLPMIAQRIGPGPGGLDLTRREQGNMFTVYGFGAILGPFVVGQLADRYFSTERLLAFCHLVGGGLLIASAYAESFWPLFLLLLVYCNLFMPSMGLTNSITFRNVGEANFPAIRLWGTLGFVAAGWSFYYYLEGGKYAALAPFYDLVGRPEARDCLRVAGVVSLFYGLYCFVLPHTPPAPAAPAGAAGKPNALIESLGLMRDRSFAVLVIVASLIGIMLAFYFACENYFLQSIGTPKNKVGAYMTIGQMAEVVVMLLVPAAIRRFGFKGTMIIGASAWAVRFGLSMIGQPWWLMIATIGLHGFCFGFFFVAAQMFVDRAAGADIKASAQNLLIFLIYGVGTIIGSQMTGEVRRYFVDAAGNDDWSRVWAGPFVLTILSILVFAAMFREKPITKLTGQPELALV